MPGHAIKPRSVWEERFVRPTADQLIGAFNKQTGGVIEHARQRLLAVAGLREGLSWHGIPWRWALGYWHEDDAERGFAFLVPEPAKPRLVVPISPAVVTELPIKKLPKAIRDGILHAPTVSGVRWCQWEITSRTAVDEVVALAELKLPSTAAR